MALEAFSDAARLGLVHSHTAHRVILASSNERGGAEATLAAYRQLRATGHLHATPEIARLVLRGLQADSPAKALAAARAFLAEGVRPNRRAWNSLACAAACAADAATVEAVARLIRAEDAKAAAEPAAAGEAAAARSGEARGPLSSSIVHLCLAEIRLLQARTAEAVEELRAAVALAPQLMGEEAEVKRALAEVLACWAAALPAGTATPGGAEGLTARCREALAACEGFVDGEAALAALAKADLTDGPPAAP